MEDNPWTEAMVAELRCLLGQQASYATIARRLGVSRNAAIGKAKGLRINPIGEGVADGRPAEVNQRYGTIIGRVPPAARTALEFSAPPRAFRREPIPPAISSDPLNLRMDQLKFF